MYIFLKTSRKCACYALYCCIWCLAVRKVADLLHLEWYFQNDQPHLIKGFHLAIETISLMMTISKYKLTPVSLCISFSVLLSVSGWKLSGSCIDFDKPWRHITLLYVHCVFGLLFFWAKGCCYEKRKLSWWSHEHSCKSSSQIGQTATTNIFISQLQMTLSYCDVSGELSWLWKGIVYLGVWKLELRVQLLLNVIRVSASVNLGLLSMLHDSKNSDSSDWVCISFENYY